MKRIHSFGVLLTPSNTYEISSISGPMLKRLLGEFRLVILRGFRSPSKDEFVQFATSHPNSELLQWDSGSVMEMAKQENPKNYLFSNEKVPFHWDGAFFKEPNYLFFHCISAPGATQGGETLFTDTESIFNLSSDADKDKFKKIKMNYKTAKVAHYGGQFEAPLLQFHPKRQTRILRFAEEVKTALNPVKMGVEGIPKEDVGAFVQSMTRKIYHPAYCYEHKWKPGDIVIADNFSLIHGRNSIAPEAPRHLRRLQLLTRRAS